MHAAERTAAADPALAPLAAGTVDAGAFPSAAGAVVLSVSRAPDLVGRTMYADRRKAGTTASEVRFSNHPVAPRLAPSAALTVGSPYHGGLPLTGSRLSSAYGYRYHPVLGGWKMHGGVDLAAASGTPVHATSAGTVRRAGWAGGYGLMVEIDHGGGVQTRYGHLSRITVAPGQAVTQGAVVGLVGSTGRSTGPHLHFETRVNGSTTNPLGR